MSLRKLIALGLLATALVVAALLAARAQARTASTIFRLSTKQSTFISAQNMGWWNSNGTHTVGNANYVVGHPPEEVAVFRDFFAFDGSLAPGCARTASLQIPIGTGSGDFGGATTGALFVMHSVETDAQTLITTGGPDTAVFDDLGDGDVYGSSFEPTAAPYKAEVFVIPLNAVGVRDLNAAILSDRFFTVGGMIAGEPADTSLFNFTPLAHGHSVETPATLLVTMGPCTPSG
jgi:hypothetical protein